MNPVNELMKLNRLDDEMTWQSSYVDAMMKLRGAYRLMMMLRPTPPGMDKDEAERQYAEALHDFQTAHKVLDKLDADAKSRR